MVDRGVDLDQIGRVSARYVGKMTKDLWCGERFVLVSLGCP